ncbi:hypothetical protein [Tepidibacter thalassicus]|uniref:Uncharacterized protein n=1 Tax=Tepidibacter thalassicus DSM 15285 TaxID=1123350 RepID=A0A1M5QZY9_9FIRM|nr:hypothetical protein [Tepidibacter thalassicus]SHH19747.1 hypothetical protein SAMN02744040_01178 [Tepidibacter thalassicus DSM 15285]
MKFKKIYYIILLILLSCISACSNNQSEKLSNNSRFSKTILYNNELYMCYSENTEKNISQIKVKKYDDIKNKWINIGNNSLNYNSFKNAINITPIVYNNELYIFWSEETNSNEFKIHIKKLNKKNNTWINALNYVDLRYGSKTYPIVYNNNLYVLVNEKNNQNSTTIYLKKFDENRKKWIDINNSYLNNYFNKEYYIKDLLIHNNEIYIFYMCNSKNNIFEIHAKKFNKDHKLVDIGNSALNYNKNKNANYPKAIIYNNELYAFWSEEIENDKSQIKIKKYDKKNNKWIPIIIDSLNNSKSTRKVLTDVTIYKNKLYICIDEEDENNEFNSKIKSIPLKNLHTTN